MFFTQTVGMKNFISLKQLFLFSNFQFSGIEKSETEQPMDQDEENYPAEYLSDHSDKEYVKNEGRAGDDDVKMTEGNESTKANVKEDDEDTEENKDSDDEDVSDDEDIMNEIYDEEQHKQLLSMKYNVPVSKEHPNHLYLVRNFGVEKITKFQMEQMKLSKDDYLPPPCPFVDPATIYTLPVLPFNYFYMPCDCYPVEEKTQYENLLRQRERTLKMCSKKCDPGLKVAKLEKTIKNLDHEEQTLLKEIKKVEKKLGSRSCPYKVSHLKQLLENDGLQRYLYKQQLRAAQKLPRKNVRLSKAVIDFSETLMKLSAEAYKYVNDAFDNVLPDPAHFTRGQYTPPDDIVYDEDDPDYNWVEALGAGKEEDEEENSNDEKVKVDEEP